MNKQLVVLLIIHFGIILFVSGLNAQVTIGSKHGVNPGSILDLKETPSTQANSTRGLNLPRVALRSIDHLYPMLDNYTDYQDNNPVKAQEDAAHTGLVVYNQTTDLNIGLCPGVYVWVGTEWRRLGKACTLPICEYDIESNLVSGYYYHYYCNDSIATQDKALAHCKQNHITNDDGTNTYTYHLMTYKEFVETWNQDATHFPVNTQYFVDYNGWITLGIIHPDGTMEVLNDVAPFALGPPIGGLLTGTYTIRCTRD